MGGVGPLLIIVGPTAVGKTDLSLRLGGALGGEVVSADSRLFYRGMDIGTAKPTLEQRACVRHHLIDIAAPDETVGLADWQERVAAAIGEAHARGKLPMLVGGTGQYVRAVVEGWQVPRVPPDPRLRAELEATAERDGPAILHARLVDLDPAAARSIDHRNLRRVIRALEVCLITGQPISEQQLRKPPPYRILQVGLTLAREALYARVDRRVDSMMAAGLEEEVNSLLKMGYGWDLPAMSGLGYGQFRPYFEGLGTLDDVATQIKRATRRFIRQQYSWFRLRDPAIYWVDVSELTPDEIATSVVRWFAGETGRSVDPASICTSSTLDTDPLVEYTSRHGTV